MKLKKVYFPGRNNYIYLSKQKVMHTYAPATAATTQNMLVDLKRRVFFGVY